MSCSEPMNDIHQDDDSKGIHLRRNNLATPSTSLLGRSYSVPASPVSAPDETLAPAGLIQEQRTIRTRSMSSNVEDDTASSFNLSGDPAFDFSSSIQNTPFSTPISGKSWLSPDCFSTPSTAAHRAYGLATNVPVLGASPISISTPANPDFTVNNLDSSPPLLYDIPDVAEETDGRSTPVGHIDSALSGYTTSQFFKPNAEETETGIPDRPHPSSCLFVASLSSVHSLENLKEEVTDLFAKWNPIDVTVHRDSADRPYSFVQLRSYEDARDALDECRGALIFDRPIRCEHARVNRALLISYTTKYMTRREAEAIFREFGQLELLISGSIMYGRGLVRGWCGKFEYREDAIVAYFQLKQDEEITIFYVQNPDPTIASSVENPSVFIRNLDGKRVTVDLLRNQFSKYGKITDVELLNQAPSDSPTNSVCALIKYTTLDEAHEAIVKETLFLDRRIYLCYGNTSKSATAIKLAPAPKGGAGAKNSNAPQQQYQHQRLHKTKTQNSILPDVSRVSDNHAQSATHSGLNRERAKYADQYGYYMMANTMYTMTPEQVRYGPYLTHPVQKMEVLPHEENGPHSYYYPMPPVYGGIAGVGGAIGGATDAIILGMKQRGMSSSPPDGAREAEIHYQMHPSVPGPLILSPPFDAFMGMSYGFPYGFDSQMCYPMAFPMAPYPYAPYIPFMGESYPHVFFEDGRNQQSINQADAHTNQFGALGGAVDNSSH